MKTPSPAPPPSETGRIRKKIWFIINLFSGSTRKIKIEHKIIRHLDHKKFTYSIKYTEGPDHGTLLAQEAVKEGCYMVVAVGGDGSVNEISKALVNTDTLLGILPSGSGNGFAMHIGMGRNIKRAIKKLNTGIPLLVDTCQLNEHHYINLAGTGFDALVAYKIKRSRLRGFLGYAKYAILEAFKYKFESYHIQIDDKIIQRECLVVEVANAPMFGYNFVVAPRARLNDGNLEVVIMKKAPKWKYLLMAWRFFNNSLHKSPLVECHKAKKVTIINTKKLYIHTDGEGYICRHNLNFSVKPLSLWILTPAKQ